MGMDEAGSETARRSILDARDLQQLLDALSRRGYRVCGPTLRDGVIIYDEISTVADLPRGWTDEQQPGLYRTRQRGDDALFGYVVGPHSWKKYLHPPILRLWHAAREGASFRVTGGDEAAPRIAFLGVRACEIRAIQIQDSVFQNGSDTDPSYRSRRENAFVVAVNCTQSGGNCFCVSMNSGPRATGGYDLALTELLSEERHVFIVDVGSDAGAEVMRDVAGTTPDADSLRAAEAALDACAAQMGRSLNTSGIKELLYRNYDHPRWDNVAARCTTCANCTLVCPTCFCTTVEDTTDLTGDHAERWRKWDSCFTMDFSYIHGGSIRSSPRSRYRQWLTHKLATWIDQFGTSGCVGCGRCITWCPVGIDITEEVREIRATELSATPVKTI